MFIVDRMKFSSILGLLLLSVAPFAASGQEIGLQLSSLQEQFEKDAPATMAKVKAMGIRQVEMKGTHGLSFPEFIKLLATNEISVVSFEADFEKLKNFPQVVTDEARSYGAKFIVCSVPSKGSAFTSQEIEKHAEIFNQAGKVIARNGLLLCYRPNGSEFDQYKEGTLFDYFIEKIDTRYVHLEMDVMAVKQAGQDPAALLKKYPSRFVLLQLKDRKPGSGVSLAGKSERNEYVVLGSGEVNIKNVVATARTLGIQYYFIEDASANAEKQIPKSLAYLRTINEKDSAKQ